MKRRIYNRILYGWDIRTTEGFRKNPPHLIILDIMLPKMDGWDVCKNIRRTSQIPIIMLTAKGETFDKVLGLELGADDYIVKPFDPKELVARVKAVLRRSKSTKDDEQIVSYPNLTINLTDYTLTFMGKDIECPPEGTGTFILLSIKSQQGIH